MSHELRTPLTSVVGFSKLISKRLAEVVYPAIGPIDDPKLERAMRQVTENLGIIVEEGERLTTLINETLDLAKIEAGRVEWRSEAVDIGDVVGRATAATASLLRPDAGPKLVVELEPGTRVQILGQNSAGWAEVEEPGGRGVGFVQGTSGRPQLPGQPVQRTSRRLDQHRNRARSEEYLAHEKGDAPAD